MVSVYIVPIGHVWAWAQVCNTMWLGPTVHPLYWWHLGSLPCSWVSLGNRLTPALIQRVANMKVLWVIRVRDHGVSLAMELTQAPGGMEEMGNNFLQPGEGRNFIVQ